MFIAFVVVGYMDLFFLNIWCAGAFGQVRGPQPGYPGPYPGQQSYGAAPAAQAPAAPAPKRLDPDSIPSPVHADYIFCLPSITFFFC